MSTSVPRLRKTFFIHEGHIAANRKLSPLALAMFLQEIASTHATQLGVGIEELLAQEKTWVLSRLKIRLTENPVRPEKITIETWPSGKERLFAMRNFVLYDDAGHVFGHADSAWLIIDVNSRRPLKIDPFLVGWAQFPYEKEWPFEPNGLPAFTPENDGRRFYTRFRDLDINQHVNNVSYMEWALEGLPWDLLFHGELQEIEIHFLGESFLGEEVVSYAMPTPDLPHWYHRIMRVSDQKELARMKSIWVTT